MATIRIKREEALNLLREAEETARKNSGETQYIEYGEALAKEMDSAAPFLDRMQEWHRAVAQGLADGSITLTKTGALKGAPVKPKPSGAEISKNSTRRDSFHSGAAYYFAECVDVDDVRRVTEKFRQQREDRLSPIKAQITLFSLATEDEIEVDQGNFHGILSGRFYR